MHVFGLRVEAREPKKESACRRSENFTLKSPSSHNLRAVRRLCMQMWNVSFIFPLCPVNSTKKPQKFIFWLFSCRWSQKNHLHVFDLFFTPSKRANRWSSSAGLTSGVSGTSWSWASYCWAGAPWECSHGELWLETRKWATITNTHAGETR